MLLLWLREMLCCYVKNAVVAYKVQALSVPVAVATAKKGRCCWCCCYCCHCQKGPLSVPFAVTAATAATAAVAFAATAATVLSTTVTSITTALKALPLCRRRCCHCQVRIFAATRKLLSPPLPLWESCGKRMLSQRGKHCHRCYMKRLFPPLLLRGNCYSRSC
jgi:hypothetical protein